MTSSSIKTKKDYLTNYAQSPALSKAILNQLNTHWSTLTANINDYLDASNGISGFIYYDDTVKFAKKNIFEILKLLNSIEADCGYISKPLDDETNYYNWLAWFALETIVGEILSYLEIDN